MLLINRGPWLGQVSLLEKAPRRRASLSGSRLGSAQALTESTFSQALSAPAAVIDFWSPSCPYCVSYKPVFEDVAAQVGGRVFMATVDVNQAPQAAGSFKIQTIPATIFLVNGKEVNRAEGDMGKNELLSEISRLTSGQVSAPPSSGGFPWVLAAGGLVTAGVLGYLALR